VADVPLEQGLAELLGYLSLREPGLDTVYDDTRTQVEWTDDEIDAVRIADLPRVIFTRTAGDTA
jgi:hypothetical protein